MAKECYCVMDSIKLVNGEQFDSLTNNQLDNAVEKLSLVAISLELLEKAHPENGISTLLKALFVEALGVLFENGSPVNEQGETSDDAIRKIPKVLKIIQLENIAERVKTSKPSRSSNLLITLEMVESVVALLDWFPFLRSAFDLECDDVASPASVLEMKLRYLSLFLRFTAKWCIEHESIKDLFTCAEDVAYAALHLCFLEFAYNMENDDDQSHVLDHEFSKLLERISPMNVPELRQIYLNLFIESKSSRSETSMDAQSMFFFVFALTEDLEELLSHDARLKNTFDDQIPWLQKGSTHLFRFLNGTLKGTSLEEFSSIQSHIEALINEVAIVIYSSCYDGMTNTEIDHELFLLQLKFNHVEVEMNLIQLLNGEATIMAPLKYLIDCVREELKLLGTFLMDSLEQCKEETKITDFLTLNHVNLQRTR